MCNGLSTTAFNGWCRDVLNALDLKCSFLHFSSWCLLFSVGGNRIVSGLDGTDILRGHLHRALLFVSTNEFCDAEVRKSRGNKFIFFKVVFDRYEPEILSARNIDCRVFLKPNLTRKNKKPLRVSRLFVMQLI